MFLSPPLFLPLVPLCLSFIMGRARLQIKEASRETEWAVTTCDAICYPQRIASGRLTRSIHLASAALIKQMPADVWLCRNEFLPLWAGNCSQSHFLSDLWSLNKHTHRHTENPATDNRCSRVCFLLHVLFSLCVLILAECEWLLSLSVLNEISPCNEMFIVAHSPLRVSMMFPWFICDVWCLPSC